MDEQYIQDLYDNLGGADEFGQFSDFRKLITSDEAYIQDFYNAFGDKTLGAFEDFQALVKKKDDFASEEPQSSLPSTSPEESQNIPSPSQKPQEEIPLISDEKLKGIRATFSPEPVDISEDRNIQAAIDKGVITDDDLISAGYKAGDAPVSVLDTEDNLEKKQFALAKIKALKGKSKEDLRFAAESQGLNKPYAYEEFDPGDTFVQENFDAESLNEMNVNIKDFNGFLNEKGYKKDFESTDFSSDYGTGTDMELAKEAEKFRMLNLYINEQYKRDIKFQKLNREAQTGVNPDYTEEKFNPSTANIDFTKIPEYVERNMPIVTSKLKERDRKNREEYEFLKQDQGTMVKVGHFVENVSKSGWAGFENRINELSSSIYGGILGEVMGIDYFANTANAIREGMKSEQMFGSDNLKYTYARGKTANVDGTQYLVDDQGQVYDVDHKANVTGLIDEDYRKTIVEEVNNKGYKDSSFSPIGASYQMSNIMGDMVVQLALTQAAGTTLNSMAGFIDGAVGRQLLANGLTKTESLLSKIPVSREMSSAIIAQGSLGASSGYENTLRVAKEAGLNNDEAQELATQAAVEMAVLYAVTAPISPQTKASSRLFGNIKKNAVQDAIDAYKKFGPTGFKEVFKKRGLQIFENLEEGVKEFGQENIQQAGETLVVNKDINEMAGMKLNKDDITLQDFYNTSILSFATAFFMNGAGQLSSGASKRAKAFTGADATDRFMALDKMVRNESKVRGLLKSQVDQGIYTQEQADGLISDMETYKRTVGKMPSSLKPKNAAKIMGDLDEISRLEGQRKTVDPSFYEDIDNKIAERRKTIQEKLSVQEKAPFSAPEQAGKVNTTPETSSNYANLTEDEEGNFVFFHRGKKGYETVKPSAGDSKATSREEAAAIGKVGGLGMYYTNEADSEKQAANEAQYAVKVPQEKVYDANTDALDFTEEAKRRHDAENPGKAFDGNSKLAYITQIAGENGFDMVVAEWAGRTRAQTTKELAPSDVKELDGSAVTKPFEETFVSNKEKGFESVIPETKEQRLQKVYDQINKERNANNNYDNLYHLRADYNKYTQKQISSLIEESDISEELKQQYQEALEYEAPARQSRVVQKGRGVRVKGAPEGTYVNVGLKVGETQTPISQQEVISRLPEDVTVLASNVEEGVESKNTEDTLTLKLSRPLTDLEMKNFLKANGQKAIPQLVNGTGTMYGTQEWGDFDPSFFVMPENEVIKTQTEEERFREILDRESDPAERRHATNAIDAMRDVAPDVVIQIHENQVDMFKAIGAENAEAEKIGGYYDPVTKTIHINAESANARTIAHEVFHATVISYLKTNAAATAFTDKILKKLYEGIADDATVNVDGEIINLKDYLEAFSRNYEKSVQSEEKLAELVSVLAHAEDRLPRSQKNVIVRFFERLAEMLGIIDFTSSDAEAFINHISRTIGEGSAISPAIFKIVKVDKFGNLPKASEQSKENLKGRAQKIIDNAKNHIATGTVVSTSLPKKGEPHTNADSIVGIKQLEQLAKGSPGIEAQYIKIANEIAAYPLSPNVTAATLDQATDIINGFKENVKKNLKWIHDAFGKQEGAISKLWYDGANKIANRIALSNGISLDQSAGVLAVLSPQKDWFMNASLAERLVKIYAKSMDHVVDPKMIDYFKNAESGSGKTKKPLFKDSDKIIKRIQGKKLSQLSDSDLAKAIRVFDEVHNSKSYNNVTPAGDVNGLVRTKGGNEAKVAWGGFNTIEKAISILKDGSAENISRNLGDMHKVRNFFNNISDPNDPVSVTMDTHAIAAALLLPLSGNSPQVKYNFSGSSSLESGMKGSYAVYADAYRELANDLGILPRELQSITWEAVRGLFKPEFKSKKANEAKLNEIWNQFNEGKKSLDATHLEIEKLAGGISKPVWFEYMADGDVESLDVNSAAIDQGNYRESESAFEDISPRKQIVGRKANLSKNADDALRLADIMTYRGEDPRNIRLATGWEKGADGLWRYEMFDGDAFIKNFNTGLQKLDEALSFPELFKAYPKLKEINVLFSDRLEPNTYGVFNEDKNRITVNSEISEDAMVTTILHEVQHAIQVIEGFAVGGSSDQVRSVLKEESRKLSVRKRLASLVDVLVSSNVKSETEAALSKLKKLSSKEDFELYQALAGEVEARNVEFRRSFSPEERLKIMLSETQEIAPEDQFVVGVRKRVDTRARDIVAAGKRNGISDEVIRRVAEEKGVSYKDINEALKNYVTPVETIEDAPDSFKSLKNGLEVLKRFMKIAENLHKTQDRDTAINTAIERLQESPEYRSVVDDILQDEMVRDFESLMGNRIKRSPSADKVLGNSRADKKIRADIKRSLKEQGKGANQLQRLKSQVRNFIRQSIPVGDYGKSEVTKMVAAVTNVKTINDLDNMIDEITAFANGKSTEFTTRKINKILDKTYTTIKSGIRVAKVISLSAKNAIEFVKNNESRDEAYKLLNEIQSKDVLTKEDVDMMMAADTSIKLLDLKEADPTEGTTVAMANQVHDNLRAIMDNGRSDLRNELLEQHEYYKANKKTAYEDIANEEYVDTEEGAKERAAKKLSLDNKMKKARSNQVKAAMLAVASKVKAFFASSESLSGMVDIMSKGVGEMFGGKLQELITDKVDESSYNYKEGLMAMKEVLTDKLKSIYGKNFKKAIRNNRTEKDTGYKLKSGESLYLSQDQAAYLYNQFKDPNNRSAFESKYAGEDVDAIMAHLENNFLTDESKEFSDWMVDELFPSLYTRYNEVYKRMNRTDMPWNSKYAGKLYRTVENLEITNILDNPNNFRQALTNGSQKERQKSNAPIEEINQIDMLFTYLSDMEFFVNYAENMRDIQKIMNDKEIRKAIIETSGQEVLRAVDSKIQNIISRGASNQYTAKLANAMTSVFITSRLGVNPVVGIKQLTSAIAFSSEIGIEQWLAQMPQTIGSFGSTWNEIVANSPYIRDRYSDSIRHSLEAYSPETFQKFIPSGSGQKAIDMLMWFVKHGDKGGIMGGIPNYLYHKNRFKKANPSATNQEAIDYAISKFQKVTKQTQQSNDIQDRDLFQDNPNLRFLQLFKTSQKQYVRKEISSIRQILRKLRGLPSKGSVRNNVENFLMYHTVLPVFFQYITLGLPGILAEWDDEDRDTLIMAGLLGNINALFIMGDVIQMTVDFIEDKPWAADADSVPFLNAIGRIVKNAQNWRRSKKPETVEKWRDKTVMEAVSLTGIPVQNVKRVYDNVDDMVTKDLSIEAKIMKALMFSDYVSEEKASKKTDKKKKKSSTKRYRDFKR